MLLLLAGCRPSTPPPAAVDAGAPRIVSLAPSLTEIVCAVGGADRLVGRTDVCNYPPEIVARVPVIGGFGQPSLEAILRQRATLVIDVAEDDEGAILTLTRLGVGHRRVPCQRLDEIPVAIRMVGELAGCQTVSEPMATDLAAQIAALRAARSASPTNGPSVYVEIWGDPPMTIGRGSYISELVTLAGGRNLGDEVATEYFNVSAEWVLTRNPDVVLCVYMSEDHSARRRVMARPGWQAVQAVRDGRVHDGFDPDVVCRPGPRVLEALRQIQTAIAAK